MSKFSIPHDDLTDVMLDERPIKTYPAGRVCKWKGCGTILTIYNPESHCLFHSRIKVMKDSLNNMHYETKGMSHGRERRRKSYSKA